ncbi:MAG: hypothetical protein K0R51_2839 [Cytophagaceae bacterium]|nr:hypothetical protein [Cytophagaceae bacterium]
MIRLIAVLLITFIHTRHSIDQTQSASIYATMLENLPKIGTALLSIISGYLYLKISSTKPHFIVSKIKTLLVPYLIANVSILIIACLLFYFMDIDILNRLDFNASLISEGVFALNGPPINPPTYFIRDIFVIFMLIELFKNKNLYMLIGLIPLFIFGHLILRHDVLYLFIGGALVANFEHSILHYKKYWIIGLSILTLILYATTEISIYKYGLSLLLFISVFNIHIQFYNVGAFTYILHLYHSPVIVASYPLVKRITDNSIMSVLYQVLIALCVATLLFFITRRFEKLRIICGYK